uniref:Reverse transcriptase Ty1/copia-type domain-containing protein n=1 Tax=Solanum lycopersicum TaxID=4081 RepID=A0A3Q7IFR9_SOLLC
MDFFLHIESFKVSSDDLADVAISSRPPTVVTSEDLYNNETTTTNNGDVPNEGKVNNIRNPLIVIVNQFGSCRYRGGYLRFEGFSFSFFRTTTGIRAKKFSDDDFIILLLYVDDMMIVGKNKSRIAVLKKDLSNSIAMKDLGPAKILGIQIHQDRHKKKLSLSQRSILRKYSRETKVVSTLLSKNFKLSTTQSPSTNEEKNEMSSIPYSSAVGSLMYAMICTRPDIAHVVGIVRRFLSNLLKKHWDALKWILRYLRGSSDIELCFGSGKSEL